MTSTAAALLRQARKRAGLSQNGLGLRSGVSQSNISAYENGSRPISDEMLTRLLDAAALRRPSAIVEERREEMIEAVLAHKGSEPCLFGSVARGVDGLSSDVDLLVRMEPGASMLDLVGMAVALEDILGVDVDVVSRGGLRGPNDPVLREAIRL